MLSPSARPQKVALHELAVELVRLEKLLGKTDALVLAFSQKVSDAWKANEASKPVTTRLEELGQLFARKPVQRQ